MKERAKSLSNDTIFDQSFFKEFTDDKKKVTEKQKFVWEG